MSKEVLNAQQNHLSNQLEAIQRCVFFLEASRCKLSWPLEAEEIQLRKRDINLFEALAAINERFSKLQDILGAAMRHAALLAVEPVDTFLKVLSFYGKLGVIQSVTTWQLYRTIRSLAAHDYETDYTAVADHFNSLHGLLSSLYGDAARFMHHCDNTLGIQPTSLDFEEDFLIITKNRA